MTSARQVIATELWRCKDKADAAGNKLTAIEFSDAILAALDAAGFVVVPKEPTEVMIREGFHTTSGSRDIYKAMIAAAGDAT